MGNSKLESKILKQAKTLVRLHPYLKNNPDENVYIYWKGEEPYLLPHKMSQREARENGFETMVNTVKLSSIIKQK